MSLEDLLEAGVMDMAKAEKRAFLAMDLDQGPKLKKRAREPLKVPMMQNAPMDMGVEAPMQAPMDNAPPPLRVVRAVRGMNVIKRIVRKPRKLRKVTEKFCNYYGYYSEDVCKTCSSCVAGNSLTGVVLGSESLKYSGVANILQRAKVREKNTNVHGASAIYPPAFGALKPAIVVKAAIRQY